MIGSTTCQTEDFNPTLVFLDPDDSCQYALRFTPQETGTRTGTLTFTKFGGNSLFLSASTNDFTGGVTINQSNLRPGVDNAIPTSNVVVVNAIVTPEMREANPDKPYTTFTDVAQIAGALTWLCTDAAAKMNGQRLRLHG